jgi:C_GCAxxG_C_C family probable redox protein
MNKAECAVACFEEGFSCAQAVLSTCGAELGLEREMALRVAGGFGAGMARMGATCGAVTGAFMAIGLRHGKTEPEDNDAKERCYALVSQFTETFKAHNGSIVCRELLGCDVSTPEGYAQAKEQGLFDTVCPRLVRGAVEIVEQLLDK